MQQSVFLDNKKLGKSPLFFVSCFNLIEIDKQ